MAKVNKGYTMVEVMIAIAMMAILAVVIYSIIKVSSTNINMQSWESPIQFGVSGISETRCIKGYLFIVNGNGGVTQVLDDQGHGQRCGGYRYQDPNY
jgi:prepilin-type N-terminal cleavage/methylation domain-containing protein